MITPAYLQTGDKIGIISSARKVSASELKPGLAVLESWGLKPVLGKHLFSQDHQFAGTDKQRAFDLQEMLDDESIKAVLFARGGYGTLRIIDNIDFRKFKDRPKWIAGYSDITVLHNHIHNLGIETIHSVMLGAFKAEANESTITLKKILFGEKLSYNFSSALTGLQKNGEAEAELVGGNLSLLYALNGSVSDIDTSNKILFIEDLDEYLYHIDRMMLNLKRSNKLKSLKGLIVGGMSKMRDNEVPFGKSAEEIISEAVQEYNYPVCYGFPAGHIDDNRALILGRKIKLEITDNACRIDF